MHINIGPHPEWIGPYQIADFLQNFGVSEDRCHEIGTWLSNTWVGPACEWIHKQQKRRVKVHLDRYDTWNADHTLALIILPVLRQLKATKHGAPGDMPAFAQTSNSAQASFDFYAEGDEAAWEAGFKQWDEIMDKMIWSFEQIIDEDWEDQYWIVKPEIDLDPHPEDQGKTTTPLRWKVMGVCDWEGRAAHERKIQEGLELFGRYYQGLWY